MAYMAAFMVVRETRICVHPIERPEGADGLAWIAVNRWADGRMDCVGPVLRGLWKGFVDYMRRTVTEEGKVVVFGLVLSSFAVSVEWIFLRGR